MRGLVEPKIRKADFVTGTRLNRVGGAGIKYRRAKSTPLPNPDPIHYI